jgi:hypothetical protein
MSLLLLVLFFRLNTRKHGVVDVNLALKSCRLLTFYATTVFLSTWLVFLGITFDSIVEVLSSALILTVSLTTPFIFKYLLFLIFLSTLIIYFIKKIQVIK